MNLDYMILVGQYKRGDVSRLVVDTNRVLNEERARNPLAVLRVHFEANPTATVVYVSVHQR